MAERLHPIFGELGEITECIPGLDICQPLEIQAGTYSKKLEKDTYSKSLHAGKQRKIEEFQINLLWKKTLPTLLYSGYDIKRSEAVTLIHYKKVGLKDVSDLIKETGILRCLNNKHILEFYGTVYGTTVGMMYLSFEPFECFLSQLLCKEFQQLFEAPVVKCVMLQLFTGLAYLHEKEIVHGDLSTKNLVVTEKGLLKISNFRNARKIGQYSEQVLSLEPCYQPVDVLLGSQTISTATDIWSATCIFGEIILRKKLFNSLIPFHVIKKIFLLLGLPNEKVWTEFTKLPDYHYLDTKSCNRFNNIGTYFKEEKSFQLIRKGFIYDPKDRISAKECLMYRYFEEEQNDCSIKSFGVKLYGMNFKFPVIYYLDTN